MKIIVNDKAIEIEEGDEIDVHQYPCDICGQHTTITVDRNGKQILRVEPQPPE